MASLLQKRRVGEDKSYADDLSTKPGIVSSRVALLLRSAEIKPEFIRFVLENTFFRGDVPGEAYGRGLWGVL